MNRKYEKHHQPETKVCPICSKICKSLGGLITHVRNSHNMSSKQFYARYGTQGHLLNEQRSIGIKGKDFVVCPMCGECRKTLFEHIKSAHGQQVLDELISLGVPLTSSKMSIRMSQAALKLWNDTSNPLVEQFKSSGGQLKKLWDDPIWRNKKSAFQHLWMLKRNADLEFSKKAHEKFIKSFRACV